MFLYDAQGGRRCTRPVTTDTWRSPSGSSAPGRMSTLAAWKTKRRCMTQPGTDTSRFVQLLLHLICIAPLPRLFCAPTASALATLFNPFLSPCAFCSDLRFLLSSRQPGFTGVYFSFEIPSRAGRWGAFLLNATEMALVKLKSFLGIFTCSSSCT